MVINRYPLIIQNKIKGYFDYSACIYPIGYHANGEQYFFNHEDIAEIIFVGYAHPIEDKLMEYYQKKLPMISYPKFSIHQ